MAELVGTHCAHPPCNALDFLPLSCPLCRRPFCALHSTPPTHLCSQLDAAPVQGHTFGDKFNDLLPDRDRRTTERADATEEREAKKLKARALLSKNFGRTPAVPTRTTGKGSKSAVIELMKLKGRATPGDVRKGPAAVSMLDRIYLVAVLLSREGEDLRETARKELWFASVRRNSPLLPPSAPQLVFLTSAEYNGRAYRGSARDSIRAVKYERLQHEPCAGQCCRSAGPRLT